MRDLRSLTSDIEYIKRSKLSDNFILKNAMFRIDNSINSFKLIRESFKHERDKV